MTILIRCECPALRDEPLTSRAARVSALLAAPEFRHIAGDAWSPAATHGAAAADAPEPATALHALTSWRPAPASEDVAYRLARWNGRLGDARCDVVATLWLEATDPDQVVIRLNRTSFPGGAPASLDAFVEWLHGRVKGTVAVSRDGRPESPDPIAAK